jgi:hypothetical protein
VEKVFTIFKGFSAKLSSAALQSLEGTNFKSIIEAIGEFGTEIVVCDTPFVLRPFSLSIEPDQVCLNALLRALLSLMLTVYRI